MMSKVKQTWLSEEPLAIKMLKGIPEGGRIPNFEPEPDWETYLFLGIEGEGEDSELVLLTETEHGNPMKEYYSLKEVKYFREEGQPDVIALPRGFGVDRPRQETFQSGSKEHENYLRMLQRDAYRFLAGEIVVENAN